VAIGAVISAIASYVVGEGVEAALFKGVPASQVLDERGIIWGRVTEEGPIATVRDATGRAITGYIQLPESPNRVVPPVMTIVGRPDTVMWTQPGPIAGSTEFTAPTGSPRMESRVIIAATPPNVQTPASGSPGGAFNYNALLASLLKWDLEAHTSVLIAADDTVTASMNIVSKGVWAWQAKIYMTNATDNIAHLERVHPVAGAATLLIAACGEDSHLAVDYQGIEIVDEASVALPFKLRARVAFADPTGTFTTNLWAKQLAAL